MMHGALAVFRFELRRTMTPSRITAWLMLVAFPVMIVSIMKYYEPDVDPYPATLWGAVLFGLVPEVITLFGLLLWVTPLVHAELEGRTWIYLAVRPRGRVSVFLGKYLTAIAWTAAAGWCSASACVLIARPEHALRLWATLVALVGLATVAYGAVYSLIAVWLHRRAMVVAVAYTLIFEFLVALIPAVINQLTVQYRLYNLLLDWMDWRHLLPPGARVILLGEQPPWVHLLALAGIVVGVLALSAQVIQRREYVTATEA
jgi:ABC-type transport system involved in multi-copper enzyme maturation permease subunit